jgi:integrase
VPQKFVKMTRLAMRALVPGKRIVEHGIVYEKLKSEDGRFELCIQVNGKRMHRTVGKESEGITRSHAEQAIEKFKNEARMGRLSLPKGRKLPMTFKEAAAQYLERLSLEGGKSLDTKKRQLKQLLIPFFDCTPLADISPFQVEQFKSHALKEGLSQSTVNRYLAVLSQLLHKAVEWDWLEKSPVKVKKYKESPGRIHYLSKEQVETLLGVAKIDLHPFIHLFILIALETGMRRMEILSIRLDYIQLDRQIIFIPEAKAGAREQPISAHLKDFLADYLPRYTKPGQQWLFPSKTAKPGHMIAIEKTFRRVVKAAGLDPYQVVRHTLRHTAITHLVQAGVDLPTVKRISGHKTLIMVERYAHQNNEHIQNALAKLDGRYGR